MTISADTRNRMAFALGSFPGGNELLAILDQIAPSADAAALVLAKLWAEPTLDSVVAHPGGGQASATPLTGEVNRIITVATAGDSVVLPASKAGLTIMIINHGANAAQVYGLGADTVNDVAAATGVSQMPGSMVIYSCTTAGAWYTEGLAGGYSGSFATASFTGGITAHPGGGQGAAVPITSMVNRVTTVGSAADSLVLPATVANVSIGPVTVANAAGVNSLNVFPATGDQINALGANTAFAVAAGKTATFYSTGAGQWHAILSA